MPIYTRGKKVFRHAFFFENFDEQEGGKQQKCAIVHIADLFDKLAWRPEIEIEESYDGFTKSGKAATLVIEKKGGKYGSDRI